MADKYEPLETSESLVKKEGSKRNVEWSKYGLSDDVCQPGSDGSYQQSSPQVQELFDEQQDTSSQKPWWKANFFIKEPVLFGTWDGVFTSCMINIFGVVIFLRTGWMVGNAGIGLSILIVTVTIIVALIAGLSAIGVCERCHVQSGGVYFLLSHVLGTRIGGTIGIMYSFGQTVACALYCTGFGESVAATFGWVDNTWAVRGVGIAVILLLLAINIAGVRWVVKLQLVLLGILGIATLDFVIGTFSHTDPENGFTGYKLINLRNNTAPMYLPGETFFSVFGVFFPTATGVMAGINMSGDLKNPSRNIPVGTLSAIGVTALLYFLYVVLLGATCERWALQTDMMIAEKVALVGFLWLAGLYISSLSSCLSGLYGAPRVLQSICQENVIPIIKVLAMGKGPNKEPILASIVVCVISIAFIFIGHVNELGPIVTMPFLLTYAVVDYAYFALAMSYDKKKTELPAKSEQDSLLSHVIDSSIKKKEADLANGGYGTTLKSMDDNETVEKAGEAIDTHSESVEVDDKMQLLEKKKDDNVESGQQSRVPFNTEISRMPDSWYSHMCNRWVSMCGGIFCIFIMFCIQWGYALANISVALIIYIYIGQANPGTKPGVVDFNFITWVKTGFQRCCRRGPPPPEQMIISQPSTLPFGLTTEQLTEDGEDYSSRGRYHQSAIVKGQNMDDFE
ncbi:solute carrier family 12 member 8-like [Saccoglossus kowalevskii]|uniref:Solute carrier family 12 member 8-like n=1 Tax=Saccoglossus kowalevskii TaxID=10224 RepID=A0ABM0MRG1_SACKO|nr:PREDICTED: solute carrier family 12 member 8-like [Saccoglossus kowalevskii]